MVMVVINAFMVVLVVVVVVMMVMVMVVVMRLPVGVVMVVALMDGADVLFGHLVCAYGVALRIVPRQGLLCGGAARTKIAVRCFHFEDPVLKRKGEHVERATTQVVGQNVAFTAALLVRPVSGSSCRGLVDDTQYVQAGHCPDSLGGLALGVIEVGWHCNGSIVPVDGFRQ